MQSYSNLATLDHSKMVGEKEKQSISIPFLWEEKPGTPKREWPMNQAPKDETSSKDGSEYYNDWYSLLSESDGNGSSDSLHDAPSMEFFFPLPLLPNAGFLERVLRESDVKKSSNEEGRLVTKRTLTLEELILLSRKLSYRKKTVDMKKKKRLLMEFIKESLPACFSSKAANHKNNLELSKFVSKTWNHVVVAMCGAITLKIFASKKAKQWENILTSSKNNIDRTEHDLHKS